MSSPKQDSSFEYRNTYDRSLVKLPPQYSHLKSLLLYSDAIENYMTKNERGLPDSDNILIAESATDGAVSSDSVNLYDSDNVKCHVPAFFGTGSSKVVKPRVLFVEDLLPGAIEAIGAGFNLNPHVL